MALPWCGMPGIHFRTVFSVARIQPYFIADGTAREIGAESPAATGFWVLAQTRQEQLVLEQGRPPRISPADFVSVFVTNRHVVDQRLTSAGSTFRLSRVEIELRQRHQGERADIARETKFFEVSNLESALFVADTADCAIICAPTWRDDDGRHGPAAAIADSMVAGEDAFANGNIEICQPVAFIGFPHAGGPGWWDTGWNFAIAREASIASLPHVPFTNDSIKTSDVTLLSGLSFNGSSGSPVFTHRKYDLDHVTAAFQLAGALNSQPLRAIEPLLVGIMSGHFNRPADEPEMLRHSGLSYMTRSTTIRALLDQAKANAFHNPRPFDGLHSVRQSQRATGE